MNWKKYIMGILVDSLQDLLTLRFPLFISQLDKIKDQSTALERRTYRLQLILRTQLFIIFLLTFICCLWLMGWIGDGESVEGACLANQNSENTEQVYTKVLHTPV